MPFNLGTATYNFSVLGMNAASRALTSFHGTLQVLGRDRTASLFSGAWQRFAGILGTVNAQLGITQALFGGLGAAGFALGVGGMVRLSAEAEQTRKSMALMIGDAAKANKLFDEITKFGDETPLNAPELLRGAQALINARVAMEDIIPTMRMLGDIGFPLRGKYGFEHLIFLYQQFKAQGVLRNQDLLQLTNLNVPLEEMAATMGMTVRQMKALAGEGGGIPFQKFHEALVKMTSEGGRFHNQLSEMAKTLLGRWSTFVDILRNNVFKDVGDRIIARFKLPELLDRAIQLARNFASTFGPTVDKVLDRTYTILQNILPTLLNIGRAAATVGLAIARTYWLILKPLSEWINNHKQLVTYLVSTYVTMRMLNAATGGWAGALVTQLVPALIRTIQLLRTLRTVGMPGLPTGGLGAPSMRGLTTLGPMLMRGGAIGGLAGLAALLGYGAYRINQRNHERAEEEGAGYGADMVGAVGLWSRQYAFDQMRTKQRAALRERLAKEAAGGASSSPETGGAGGLPGPGQVSWVGISQLAEQMQLNALQQSALTTIGDATSRTADAMESLADLVTGGALPVMLAGRGSHPVALDTA